MLGLKKLQGLYSPHGFNLETAFLVSINNVILDVIRGDINILSSHQPFTKFHRTIQEDQLYLWLPFTEVSQKCLGRLSVLALVIRYPQ